MSDGTTAELRQWLYEVAEGIAPTWIKRADFVETVTTPVREWLLRELAPAHTGAPCPRPIPVDRASSPSPIPAA